MIALTIQQTQPSLLTPQFPAEICGAKGAAARLPAGVNSDDFLRIFRASRRSIPFPPALTTLTPAQCGPDLTLCAIGIGTSCGTPQTLATRPLSAHRLDCCASHGRFSGRRTTLVF
jgi:hypothetical protein